MKTLCRVSALLFACVGIAHCNTEIVNLAGTPSLDLPFNADVTWPVLNPLPGRNSKTFTLHPISPAISIPEICQGVCPHEQWIKVELDDIYTVVSYEPKFTLRLSWPASMPTHFDISVFKSPTSNSNQSSIAPITVPLHQYVRIRGVSAGLPRPSPDSDKKEPVVFNVILEPLIWGFLPRSVVPILFALLAVITIASFAVPRVFFLLSRLADDASMEVERKGR